MASRLKIVALPEMPRDQLLLVPSALPEPMTLEEATKWLADHSCLIVNLTKVEDDGTV